MAPFLWMGLAWDTVGYSAKRQKEILLMFIDGGGNQNVARILAQNSMIRLFIQKNLDMLVALCCCPTQS